MVAPRRLDPVELNRSAPSKPAPKGRPGAKRAYLSRGFVRRREQWRQGWNRDARCPPDPKYDATPGREGWRSCGVVALLGWWHEQHGKRVKLTRELRWAGYVARQRFARRFDGYRQVGRHQVARWSYVDPGGPLDGLPCVDPWTTAERLGRCGAAWCAPLRYGDNSGLSTIAVPRLCGQRHVCPVCARRRSNSLAGALRDVIEAEDAGPLALVTLTHRVREGESLRDAFARWRGAWSRMTKGRPGRRFRAKVHGWHLGIEAGANAAKAGRWHVHGHVVLRLRAGADELSARRWMAGAWGAATRAESGTDGWDGMVGVEEHDGKRGPWWREIDPTNLARVYQACKYPTPAAELDSVALVEFLAVSYYKRWHEGGGAYRGIIKRADALERSHADGDTDDSRNIASLAPGECPDLDEIAPDLGWGETPKAPPREYVHWRLAEGVCAGAISMAARKAGGSSGRRDDGTLWVTLPTSWASGVLRGRDEEARPSEPLAAGRRPVGTRD